MEHLGDTVTERDLLGLEVELDGLHPPPPRMRPRATVLWMSEAISKQVLHEPMFRPALVSLRGRPRADEVPQRLVGRVGNPHSRQRPALVAEGQLLRVPTVRLDLVARLPRNQRRRDDIALDTHLRQLPVQRVAGRPGLVAIFRPSGPPSCSMNFRTDSGRFGNCPRLRACPRPSPIAAAIVSP